MSMMGGRKDRHNLVDGIPQSQASMAIGRSAFIDVTKEIPLDTQQQAQMGYDGGQQHMNSMGSYQMQPSAPGSRNQSMTSAISRRFRKPHFTHNQHGSMGGNADDDDFMGDANITTNAAEPNMSLGDLRHLRGGGRYGGATFKANSSIDTLSYVPTYDGVPVRTAQRKFSGTTGSPSRPGTEISNTAYRKQQIMQKKLNAMRMAQRGGAQGIPQGAPMQQFASGGPRTMSLQSFGGPGYGRRANMGAPMPYQGPVTGSPVSRPQGHLNSMSALGPRPLQNGMQGGMGLPGGPGVLPGGQPGQPGGAPGYPRAMSMQTTGYYRGRANQQPRFNRGGPQFRRPPFGNPQGPQRMPNQPGLPPSQNISRSSSQNSASNIPAPAALTDQNASAQQIQKSYSQQSQQNQPLQQGQQSKQSQQHQPLQQNQPGPYHSQQNQYNQPPRPPQHGQYYNPGSYGQTAGDENRSDVLEDTNPGSGARHADFSVSRDQSKVQNAISEDNRQPDLGTRDSFPQELDSVPEQAASYEESRGPAAQKSQVSDLAGKKIFSPMNAKPSQLPPEPSLGGNRYSTGSWSSHGDRYSSGKLGDDNMGKLVDDNLGSLTSSQSSSGPKPKPTVFQPQTGHVKVNRYDFSDSDEEADEENEGPADREQNYGGNETVSEQKAFPFKSSSSSLQHQKNTALHSSERSKGTTSRSSSGSFESRASGSISGRSKDSGHKGDGSYFKVPVAPALANDTSSFTSSSTASYSDSIRKTPDMTLKTSDGENLDEIDDLDLSQTPVKSQKNIKAGEGDGIGTSGSFDFRESPKHRENKSRVFNPDEADDLNQTTFGNPLGSTNNSAMSKSEDAGSISPTSVNVRESFKEKELPQQPADFRSNSAFSSPLSPDHNRQTSSHSKVSDTSTGVPNSFGSSLLSKNSKTSSNLARKPPPFSSDGKSESSSPVGFQERHFFSFSPNPQAQIPPATQGKHSPSLEEHSAHNGRFSGRRKSSRTFSSIENAIAKSPRVAGAKNFFKKLAHKNLRRLSRGHTSLSEKQGRKASDGSSKSVSQSSADFNDYPPLSSKENVNIMAKNKPLPVPTNSQPTLQASHQANHVIGSQSRLPATPEIHSGVNSQANLPTRPDVNHQGFGINTQLRSPIRSHLVEKLPLNTGITPRNPQRRSQFQKDPLQYSKRESATNDALANYRLTIHLPQNEEEEEEDHRLSRLLKMDADNANTSTANVSPQRHFKRGSPSNLVADKRYTNLSDLTRDPKEKTPRPNEHDQGATNIENGSSTLHSDSDSSMIHESRTSKHPEIRMRNESTGSRTDSGQNSELRQYLDPAQLGILTDTEKIMHELQVVSTELASSISRELSLESKMKFKENVGPSIIYDTKSASKIADLVSQLNEERNKRYAVEQTLLKVANGTSYGSEVTKLNYENSALKKQIVDLEEGQKSTSTKLQMLLEEKESLSLKLEKMTEQYKNLTNNVVPGLKNRIEILSSGNTPNESLEEQVSTLRLENENLKQKQVTQDDDNTTIKSQRDSFREALKNLKAQNEVNLRLHTEKVKNLEEKLSKLSTINAELSKKLRASGLVSRGELSVMSSPSGKNDISFNQNA